MCKTDRMHTVIAADDEGAPLRVACGYCHSEHNYRRGPRVPASGAPRVNCLPTVVRSSSWLLKELA